MRFPTQLRITALCAEEIHSAVAPSCIYLSGSLRGQGGTYEPTNRQWSYTFYVI